METWGRLYHIWWSNAVHFPLCYRLDRERERKVIAATATLKVRTYTHWIHSLWWRILNSSIFQHDVIGFGEISFPYHCRSQIFNLGIKCKQRDFTSLWICMVKKICGRPFAILSSSVVSVWSAESKNPMPLLIAIVIFLRLLPIDRSYAIIFRKWIFTLSRPHRILVLFYLAAFLLLLLIQPAKTITTEQEQPNEVLPPNKIYWNRLKRSK